MPARPTSSVTLPIDGGVLAHVRRGLTLLWRERGFSLLALLFGLVLWALASIRLLLDPTPRVPILFNWTRSLPYWIAYVDRSHRPIARGDLVVFPFSGTAAAEFPELRNQPFFKIVQGLPGDRVAVDGRNVYVNGVFVGYAKSRTVEGKPLDPVAPGVVPPGYLYVRGTDADSFDSRYRQSGLVPSAAVLSRVVAIF